MGNFTECRNETRYYENILEYFPELNVTDPYTMEEVERVYKLDYENDYFELPIPYLKYKYFLYRNTTNCNFLMNRNSKISWKRRFKSEET